MDWAELRPLAEARQVGLLLSSLNTVADAEERIAVSQRLIRHMAFDEWENKDLDVMTAVADFAIEEGERVGGDLLEAVNVTSYNTSANLCDCWGDGFQRKPKHFKKGIDYARKALWLRSCLGKGPGPEAMATWALGKHQHSLGRIRDATRSFRKCLLLETLAAKGAGKPAEVCVGTTDGYLIAASYLALMERNRVLLASVKEVLHQMVAQSEDAKVNADIISSQLLETAKMIDATLWLA